MGNACSKPLKSQWLELSSWQQILPFSGPQVHSLAGETLATKQRRLHDHRWSRKPASVEVVSSRFFLRGAFCCGWVASACARGLRTASFCWPCPPHICMNWLEVQVLDRWGYMSFSGPLILFQRVSSSEEQEGCRGCRHGGGRHTEPAAEHHFVHTTHRQPGLESRQAGPVRLLGLWPGRPRPHRHQTQPCVKGISLCGCVLRGPDLLKVSPVQKPLLLKNRARFALCFGFALTPVLFL